jgi:hypothetical protein
VLIAEKYWPTNPAIDEASGSCDAAGAIITEPTVEGPGEPGGDSDGPGADAEPSWLGGTAICVDSLAFRVVSLGLW